MELPNISKQTYDRFERSFPGKILWKFNFLIISIKILPGCWAFRHKTMSNYNRTLYQTCVFQLWEEYLLSGCSSNRAISSMASNQTTLLARSWLRFPLNTRTGESGEKKSPINNSYHQQKQTLSFDSIPFKGVSESTRKGQYKLFKKLWKSISRRAKKLV